MEWLPGLKFFVHLVLAQAALRLAKKRGIDPVTMLVDLVDGFIPGGQPAQRAQA